MGEGQVMSSRCCPYGYEYIAATKRIQVLERDAVWARKMYEWVVYEGCSLRQVAQRLLANNVPTRNGSPTWHPSAIREILANETNAGVWHYGRQAIIEPKNPRKQERKRAKSSKEDRPRSEWLSVTVPALVSRELFEAAGVQLERNKAMSARNTKNEYLFRSLLKCARCGYRMCGITKTSGGITRRYYECVGRTRKPVYQSLAKRCDQPSVPLERIETLVWDEFVRQLSDEGVLRAKLEEIEETRRRGRKDDETELEMLTTMELGLKRNADEYLDLYMDNVIDKVTLQGRMALVREKQVAIARSKAEATARLAHWERGPGNEEAIRQLCEIAKLGLPKCNYEERRAFLEGMDVMLTLDGDKVTVTGLITENSTLTLAGRRAVLDKVTLCHTPLG